MRVMELSSRGHDERRDERKGKIDGHFLLVMATGKAHSEWPSMGVG